ncbi:Arm DNA-binding domain-containing protein [Shewanella sp. WPAGA9]|uniref:Arm DNA-binding domain-containing protein n=1 Tax=Shewanella sp. ENK2 TaxID=2775245 RepID=UPI00177FAC07|nr:DUF3596 domain-containing protein [Shewanella sp. WPAGA9]
MGSINVRNNKLYLDFRFKGVRCREMTTLEDKAANRIRATAVLKRIEAEIQLNQFKYSHHFPNSKNAQKFDAYMPTGEGGVCAGPKYDLVREFVEQWLLERKAEWRPSQLRTIEDILALYVLPRFGDVVLNDAAERYDFTSPWKSIKTLPVNRKPVHPFT